MTPIKRQRLLTLIWILLTIGTGVGLLLYSLSQNINLYVTPSQIIEQQQRPHAANAWDNRTVRLGGLVVANSVVRNESNLEVSFQVTDGRHAIRVRFDGILPDLFREQQAVVAVGTLNEAFELIASQVLAKHDENYMPSEAQHALDEAKRRQGLTP